MSITIGPSSSWLRTKEVSDFFAVRCPAGTRLGDGSSIFCKASNRAWIVAPASTQVGSAWADGKYNNIDVLGTEVCCISEWTTLCTALINNCFNPCDWFVPNISQVISGYNCRSNWDSCNSAGYWSSTECNSTCACCFVFVNSQCATISKTSVFCVRAIRCVTY